DEGSYEFVFPLVVGPRYNPGTPVAGQTNNRQSDTMRVPDASRINPHVAPEGMRAGHDVTISVIVDAGVPITALHSKSHEILTEQPDAHSALVQLKDLNVIPNKDFVLRYDVAGKQIENALLAHSNGNDGYFTLILQPPAQVAAKEITPKELVFVL